MSQRQQGCNWPLVVQGESFVIRVCLLVHQYPYRHARVLRFAETLADAGAQVDLLCLRDPKHPRHGFTRGVRVFTIPLSRRPQDRPGRLCEYMAALILFTVHLLRLHVRNRYDVVQVHNMPDFLVFSAFIPKLLGARLVLDICDPMPEFYRSKCAAGQKHGVVVSALAAEEKLSTGFVHAVTCANPNFKEVLVRRGVPADKITVVNYVPDPRLFARPGAGLRRAGKGTEFVLVYPGTIAPRYGLDVAIRALPALAAQIPRLKLVILGPQDEYSRRLAVLAEQLGVSASVELRPLVPLGEVATQIAGADVGIYPALHDAHMSIAVPLKVLEYAMMGIPVVASRLKALTDLFPESAAMFFEPGDVDGFARCVLELFGNPARREELVRAADRAVLPRLSWNEERQIYFEMLDRLLATGERLAPLARAEEGQAGEAS